LEKLKDKQIFHDMLAVLLSILIIFHIHKHWWNLNGHPILGIWVYQRVRGGVVLFNILFGAYSKHYGKSYLGIREI